MDEKNLKILNLYERLVEISLDLASTLDLDTLLARILNAAEEFTSAEASSILLWDEKRQELIFQSASNPKDVAPLLGMTVPKESLAGWVAMNHEPVIVPDVHQDQRFFGKVEKKADYPTRNLIAIPLMIKEKLIGVLEVLNRKTGTFTEEDQSNLLALGAQAALAIENSRLFQQSDLISELVHELRTPLTSINTIACILQRPEISADQRNSLVQTIIHETRRMDELATSFLDLARLESGRAAFHMGEVDITALLEEIIRMNASRAEQAGLTFSQEVESDLPPFLGDVDKIKQVLLNLVSNAIKYNRPGGKIILSAHRQSSSMILGVADTGMGISEEEMPMLFGRFFRSKNTEGRISGTGLGLSICRKIIEAHGGKIHVQSKFGEGTVFTVQLPINQ